MRFISFASSSKGNCTLISYKDTNILVDCGISKKKLIECLKRYELTLEDIKCILVTHEHSDHISGIVSILKEVNIDIVSQRATLMKIYDDCKSKGFTPNIDKFRIINPVNVMNDNVHLNAGDIKFFPIKGCHDVPSLYYKFIIDGIVLAIVTDLGAYNDYNLRSISDVNYLMLECNYDEQMILENNYPSWLKTRIIGKGGHLSNKDCAEMIIKLSNGNLKEVYLSHISDDSNSEEYAYEFVTKYISDNVTNKSNLKLPNIKISKRLEVTEIINNLDN